MELAVNLIIFASFLAGDWQIVKKSGRNPLTLFIPVYNILIHLDIAGLRRRWLIYATAVSLIFASLISPNWYTSSGLTGEEVASLLITLLLIPLCIKIAKNFGRSFKFGIGMALLPFVFAPILGFGSSAYMSEKPSETTSQKSPLVTGKRIAIVLSSLLLLFGIGVYTTETYEECVARVKSEHNSNRYRTAVKGAGMAGAAGYAAGTAGLTGSAMGVGSAGIAGGAFAMGIGWTLATIPFIGGVLFLDWLVEQEEIQKEIQKQCGDKK